jgi:hypothetical protein
MRIALKHLPSPSMGEGGVGVRISGAERPSFSPHPNLPPPGGKENDASLANRVPNSIAPLLGREGRKA